MLPATELLFRDDAYLKTCDAKVLAITDKGVVLDRTVFYPLGGGQPGDAGVLVYEGASVPIVDTRKGEQADTVLHLLEPMFAEKLPALKVGASVECHLDWGRRYKLMRLHTALHVMSCVVIAPVTGGNIAPDKARLDFDIDISLLNAQAIEEGTNALINKAVPTQTQWITDEEMDQRPELVKTMSVKPPRGAGRVRLLAIPGVDLQPCGGTHVANIQEIGAIKVVKIKSEGSKNKRVEIVLA